MLADLVVISGYSGAGKSSAMNVFEDAGYFCVDNLPPAMIRSLAAMFTDDGVKVERACVVCDARGGEYFDELAAVLDELDAGARAQPGPVPRGRRPGAAQPLQGDAPAASAAPATATSPTASGASARCSSRSAPAPTSSSTRPG